MAEDLERKLALIQNGKMADILLRELGQRIRARQEVTLKVLSQNFRSGQYTEASLASGVAAYCALEDLHSDLVKESTKGNQAQKELNDVRESGPGTR